MLENNLQWRKTNADILDNILTWEPPEEVVQNCPYRFTGHDEEGRPGKQE